MAALSQKKSWRQYLDDFKEFMWNPSTHEFMGRTGKSWALIVAFYIVFYAFLTAVFVFSMWIMLLTMDEYTPKYSDRLGNPGLMIRPKIPSMVISFNVSSGYQQYVDGLNSVLQGYNRTVQEEKGTECPNGTYFLQPQNEDVQYIPKKACQFLRDSLMECSGIEDTTYGYANGTPCVLIKMNKVINFLPEPVPSISNSSVTITCAGKNFFNDPSLGSIQYFPGLNGNSVGSIDLMYFPYYGNRAQQNYSQPFVAVKFLNATRNMDHNVECRISAANIINQDDRDKFQGRVMFTLRINS